MREWQSVLPVQCLHYKKNKKCEVWPKHCWGSANAAEALKKNLGEKKKSMETIQHPKQHFMPFLILTWAKNAKGVLKCLQLCNIGTKCALWMYNMNEILHLLPVLLYKCCMSIWSSLNICCTKQTHRSVCFIPETSLSYRNHIYFFYISFVAYSCYCARCGIKPKSDFYGTHLTFFFKRILMKWSSFVLFHFI